MRNRLRATAGVLLVACLGALAPAAGAQTSQDIQDLKNQIQDLKDGQKEMQETLAAIKQLLTAKQPPAEDVFISTNGSRSMGEQAAKVVVVEFSDYQCPFCGQFARDTFSKLVDGYVKTGKVRYVLRNFPLSQIHPQAAKASEAAECAGDQDKYWEMHDRLFTHQGALKLDELPGHAESLGLDAGRFKECLESGKYLSKVNADLTEGSRLNVRGTPTFFFGFADEKDPQRMKAVRLISGAQPANVFTDVLDALVKDAAEKADPPAAQ